LVEKSLPHAFDDLFGGRGTDVGKIQAFFKLREKGFIDAAFETKERGYAAESLAGLGQTLFDSVEDGAKDHAIPFVGAARGKLSSKREAAMDWRVNYQR